MSSVLTTAPAWTIPGFLEARDNNHLFINGADATALSYKYGTPLFVFSESRIRANITAKEVVIHGRVDGNISGKDRVELRKSAVLAGDIVTQRILIEDGAYFKGGIDISKDQTPRREQQAGHATSTPVTPVTTPSSSPVPAAPASSTRG